MTGILNVLVAPTPAASGSKAVTYQGQSSQGSGTNYSFTTQPFGTATSDRVIIVAVCLLNSNRTVSSVTIGGVSAPASLVRSQRGLGTVEFWAASVPTGSTGTIAVNCSGAADRCGIIIWSATGLSGTSAVSTGTESTTTNPHTTGSFATSNGGFVLAAACDNGGSATFTESVTGGGSPTVTEDYDGSLNGAGVATMMGMHTGSTDGTSITVTVNQSSTNANGGVAAVSF